MANNMSDYAENKVLELLVGKTAFSTPTAYLALYTVTPTDAGGGTQVTGGVQRLLVKLQMQTILCSLRQQLRGVQWLRLVSLTLQQQETLSGGVR
jgi:hypothetical protein